MKKLLKFVLPLFFVLISSNLEISNGNPITDYSNSYASRTRNNFTPSVVLRGKSILENTEKASDEEVKEFFTVIKDNNMKIAAAQLLSQLLSYHFYNIEKFNYKYIQELETNGIMLIASYFDAMKNGLQSIINNKNENNKLIIKSPFEKYNNSVLDNIATIYISNISKNNIVNEELQKCKVSKSAINDAIYHFNILGFDKIFYKIVKGTLKAKEVTNKTLLDNKPTTKFSEFNNNTGICSFNASMSALQASGVLSSEFSKMIDNSTQKKEESLKKSGGKLLKQVTRTKIPGGERIQEQIVEDRKSVNIFDIVNEYIENKKKKGENSEYLKQEKEVLDKIKEQKEFNKEKQKLINQGNVDKLLKFLNNPKNNKGANSLHTLNLWISVLGLKDKLMPKYNVDKTDDNTDDNIICGKFIEGKVGAINQYNVDGFSTRTSYETINNIIVSKQDILTCDINHYITKLPEYMVIQGVKQEGNINHIGKMKFDEKIHKYIYSFDENGELVVGQLSSMVMEQKNRAHAVAIYIDKDNSYYMMDDNTRKVEYKTKDGKTQTKTESGYYKIANKDKDKILNEHNFEYGIYKQIYRGGLDKDSKNKITSGIIVKEDKKEDNKKKEQNNSTNTQQNKKENIENKNIEQDTKQSIVDKNTKKKLPN